MGRSTKETQADIVFMQMAVAEARKGSGFVQTNPMVGAVIVHNEKVIAKSYHAKYGGPHAEVRALQAARKKHSAKTLRESTIYITLEPCTRQGKTPPCAPTVMASGVKRVVIGATDPNPHEKGRSSIGQMRRAGITVTTGVARDECEYLIRAFSKWINTKHPFVIGKVGMSIDGKITHPSQQQYITNPKSLHRVHELRQETDAILVGVNTIIKDDPMLNTRLKRPESRLSHPTKIILDSRLRTPRNSQALDDNTIIVCLEGVSHKQRHALAKTGADIIELPLQKQQGKLLFETMNMKALLKELGKRGKTSILVEGGSFVFTSFINQKLIDEFYIFVAPYLYGATYLPFTYALKHSVTIEDPQPEKLGDNILVRGYAKYN